MKIYKSVTINMENMEVIKEDSFEYDGPLALCYSGAGGAHGSHGGGSSGSGPNYGGYAASLGIGYDSKGNVVKKRSGGSGPDYAGYAASLGLGGFDPAGYAASQGIRYDDKGNVIDRGYAELSSFTPASERLAEFQMSPMARPGFTHINAGTLASQSVMDSTLGSLMASFNKMPDGTITYSPHLQNDNSMGILENMNQIQSGLSGKAPLGRAGMYALTKALPFVLDTAMSMYGPSFAGQAATIPGLLGGMAGDYALKNATGFLTSTLGKLAAFKAMGGDMGGMGMGESINSPGNKGITQGRADRGASLRQAGAISGRGQARGSNYMDSLPFALRRQQRLAATPGAEQGGPKSPITQEQFNILTNPAIGSILGSLFANNPAHQVPGMMGQGGPELGEHSLLSEGMKLAKARAEAMVKAGLADPYEMPKHLQERDMRNITSMGPDDPGGKKFSSEQKYNTKIATRYSDLMEQLGAKRTGYLLHRPTQGYKFPERLPVMEEPRRQATSRKTTFKAESDRINKRKRPLDSRQKQAVTYTGKLKVR